MNFFRRNNKMNVNRGVARAAPRVPMMPPCMFRRINMQSIFSSARLLLTPFAGPNICSGPCSCSLFASKIEYIMLRGTELIHAAISLLIQNNVTCSITRPGCGHTNLVSTLSVTQRDPPSSPPPPASF